MIPTPGHTPGSTCFLVASPHGKRYLFTGDTFYLDEGGGWRAGCIAGCSDRDALAESLELLRGVDPDIVICSAFGGRAGYQELDPDDWPGYVAQACARLLE